MNQDLKLKTEKSESSK